MLKKQIFLTVIVVFVVGFISGVLLSYGVTVSSPNQGGDVSCTMDAKICPDGSYVGRIPPNCEFLACPPGSERPAVPSIPTGLEPETNPFFFSLGEPFTLGLNQVATITDTGLEVEITGFINSPCPKGAQCIWSGVGIDFTYRLNGKVEKGVNLTEAFGYQVVIGETDYETYANLTVEKI